MFTAPDELRAKLGGLSAALYTHVLPSHDRDAADAFGAALEAAQKAPLRAAVTIL